ncbi:ABC transporter substrate-binding protein [Shewanella inventionis]|uniref:Toluene tolerance protein n=2 Tax=Shewanella inventionis TaxID=1738770 RepID=A0ABQ1IME8_9GAMM|nr:ABC transporter substrate-binding protein [Shewanella inventionis]MCL1156602.1 ABC transporter substrate-binding protein [Shewanella inventionis]UAL44293.1 ABC transporter substrate-binding protein [Shewanella inventionis]GGB46737.1 toluene tolerance protein [Shewanella inventionis]
MKALFSRVIALCLVGSAVMSSVTIAANDEINTNDPYEMIKQVANKTFDRFKQDRALIDSDLSHLKVIVNEELMPYVDYKYAAYKVMGQYLRDTTPDQRDRFVEAFEGYLVATYAQALTEYTNQAVEFDPATDFKNEKIVEVNVQIIEKGRPPIKVQFKARRLKDNTWKAFDLVAEGVSLLASKQSEISNLIRQQGIEAVISMLNDKTKQKIDRQPEKEAAAA